MKDHPETRRMLEDIKAGGITGLIFSKLARLARNTRELLDFADIFRKHDADPISLQGSIDTSTSCKIYTPLWAVKQRAPDRSLSGFVLLFLHLKLLEPLRL